VNEKAISPVVGIILLVLITVVVGSFLLAILPRIPEKPPFVSYAEGEVLNSYKGGTDDQVVLLVHRGGDEVDVRRLTLHVEIIRENQVIAWFKLWNFPWKDDRSFSESGVMYLDDKGRTEKDASSKDLYIDESVPSKQPWLGELSDRYGDGVWSVGEHIGFRIKKGGINLEYGDIVRIRLMYDEEAVILEKDIVVSSDV